MNDEAVEALKPKLLPCPCCGGEARVYSHSVSCLAEATEDVYLFVACSKCSLQTANVCNDPYRVINVWNTRVVGGLTLVFSYELADDLNDGWVAKNKTFVIGPYPTFAAVCKHAVKLSENIAESLRKNESVAGLA